MCALNPILYVLPVRELNIYYQSFLRRDLIYLCFEKSSDKKRAQVSTYRIRGRRIPSTDKSSPRPRSVSYSTYRLVLFEISYVSNARLQANTSNYFMKNRKNTVLFNELKSKDKQINDINVIN